MIYNGENMEDDKSSTLAVEFTRLELVLLNNALNEICNGPNAIEEWEFHTRLGLI